MRYEQLNADDRQTLTRLHDQGLAQRQIARRLGRSPSTISRELSRNADAHGGYHWTDAQQQSDARRSRASQRFRTDYKPLSAFLRRGFQQRHSPELMSGRLRIEYPADDRMWISHEAIYQYAYREHQAGRSVARRMCRRHTYRRPRSVGQRQDGRGRIPGRVGIEKRPKVVEDRRRYGDWEVDTVEGRKGTGLLVTLLERKSRVVRMVKVADKRADTVARAIVKALSDLPAKLRRTITADNGKEFARFAWSDARLGLQTFFANPHSPWERGANEQVNGLIRAWLPKGTSFKKATHATVARIQRMLNNRPRKCLAYRTPLEVINRLQGVALHS